MTLKARPIFATLINFGQFLNSYDLKRINQIWQLLDRKAKDSKFVYLLYFFRLSMIEAEEKRESEEKVNQSC